MKVYLDFDGVILDTESVLQKEFEADKEYDDRHSFIKNYDWFKLMNNNLVINNSLDFIRNSKVDVCLLSKISCMCEGQAKIKYLRGNDISIDICLVPTGINKCDLVNAKGNVLIDDKINNLRLWNECGGISIFFNKDMNNIDMYGVLNPGYMVIDNLAILVNPKLIKKD